MIVLNSPHTNAQGVLLQFLQGLLLTQWPQFSIPSFIGVNIYVTAAKTSLFTFYLAVRKFTVTRLYIDIIAQRQSPVLFSTKTTELQKEQEVIIVTKCKETRSYIIYYLK